jgi:hypothetical protein
MFSVCVGGLGWFFGVVIILGLRSCIYRKNNKLKILCTQSES